MRNFYKFLALLCISISISFFTAGCKEDSNKVVEEKKKVLVMGTTADYPPFQFIKDKKIRGFDIDLATLIAKKAGYSLYIKDMNFDNLIPALQTQRIDFAISSFSATEERKRNVDFSIPYFMPTYAVLYNKSKPIAKPEDFKDKIVGVQLGTTMETYLKEKALTTEKLKIISLSRIPAMVQELKLKRLDGIMVEHAQAQVIANKHGLEYILLANSGDAYSVAFPKGSPLREKFNDIITKLRDSGELDELKKKWLF